MKTFKVLMTNLGGINKWLVTVQANTADEAIKALTGKYYGAYPLKAVEA